MANKSLYVINWRKRFKAKTVAAMGSKCQCCGYDRCLNALDLHHIDPNEKELSFGSIRASPKSLDRIVNELKKCILVCSNCHREIHDGMRALPEIYAKLDETVMVSEYELRRRVKKQTSITDKIKPDRRKIFLTESDLIDILNTQFAGNKSALARHLGVSETAIRKRLKLI